MNEPLPANPTLAAHANGGVPLDDLVASLVDTYDVNDRMSHLDAEFLPNRQRTIEIIELTRRLMFPGFFDTTRLTSEIIRYHVGDLLIQLRALLNDQIRQAIRYDENLTQTNEKKDCEVETCDQKAARLTAAFLQRLPHIRHLLGTDIQAAFDGDPAARSTDETIFCYPGIDATFIHRVAHELFNLGIPLLPRIMSEYAHNETGIDIHPGATIDESFFIDHGTGVVIGETCTIGKHVKVYQGVTLGALSTKGGQAWRGCRRHPTIEDNVTIYGGAIILGDIIIGHDTTIGGSVFLTQAIPPHHTVSMKPQELEIRERRKKGKKAAAKTQELDFQI
jgi:serine O-acetyltransferase